LQGLLNKPEVTHITVIEKDVDVLELVGKHITDPRVTLIHADAYEYNPPKDVHYDFIWHDIWDNITNDNLPEMTKLHRKYARKTGWQDSWCKSLCKQRR
jgi:spermidine synthase